jgi:hypothetical protein
MHVGLGLVCLWREQKRQRCRYREESHVERDTCYDGVRDPGDVSTSPRMSRSVGNLQKLERGKANLLVLSARVWPATP